MCNLLIGFNNTPNNEEFSTVIQAQFATMRTQRNGAAGVVVTFDKKVHIFREFTDYDAVYENVAMLLPQAKMVSVHTRISTGGTLGMTNVHYFRDGDYIMAHNGMISGCYAYHKPQSQLGFDSNDDFCKGCFQSKEGLCKTHKKELGAILSQDAYVPPKEEDGAPCDTLTFLRELQKPVTTGGLRTFAEEKDFQGMGVIMNIKTLEVFMIVKKSVVMLTNEKDYAAFFSFSPTMKLETENTAWKTAFGIPFVGEVKKEKKEITRVEKQVSYGTFKVDYLNTKTPLITDFTG